MEVKANFRRGPENWKLPKFREPGLQGGVFNLRNLIPMWSKQKRKLLLPLLSISFLLQGLVGSLGLLALECLGGGSLDDTDSDGLPHVTDSEPSQGGKELKASTHIGLDGTSTTMAASPDLMNLGLSSVDLPVRRSTFSLISANLQAIWAVWQSSTGLYPLETCPGWLRTMTWAVKSATPQAGLFLGSEATYPLLISFTETFLMLNPTLSPGIASGRDSWCISTDLTSVES